MPKTIETTVYFFSELSDSAKEKARDWFRSACEGDTDWNDYVYEDAKECGKLMGIVVDNIRFSGFSSQGDGACFEGRYAYAKDAVKAIAAHAPQDETLARIAAALEAAQANANFALSATVNHRGRYYHEYCTDIDVSYDINEDELRDDDETPIVESLREFMRWIYRQLERAYDDYMSNENVDETITINEYTFTVEGRRFG